MPFILAHLDGAYPPIKKGNRNFPLPKYLICVLSQKPKAMAWEMAQENIVQKNCESYSHSLTLKIKIR